MSIKIAGISIDHIEKTKTTTQTSTTSLADSVTKNFVTGMVAGAIGQVIPTSSQPRREIPRTKAIIARLNGIKSEGIVLTANKTEMVVSSCWGGAGFSHPIDYHYHPHHAGHKPGGTVLA